MEQKLENTQELNQIDELTDQTKEECKEYKERIESLEKELKEKDEKIAKLNELLRASNERVVSLTRESELIKEKARKDKEEIKLFANETLIKDILNVLDNFERALSHIDIKEASSELKNLYIGIEMTYKDLKRVLEKHNVEEIDLTGQEFDPYLAEAIETSWDESFPPNTVLKTLQKGYKLHNKVLRASRVVVNVEPEEIT